MRKAAEKAVNIKLNAKKQIIEKLHEDASTLSQLKTSSFSAGLDTIEPIMSLESDIKDASFKKRYMDPIMPKTPSTKPMKPNSLSNLYISNSLLMSKIKEIFLTSLTHER